MRRIFLGKLCENIQQSVVTMDLLFCTIAGGNVRNALF